MVSKLEIGKDTLQGVAESAIVRVGNVAAILIGAVRDVVREVGELASDGFEIGEAARRAAASDKAPQE